jgi:hypothetical protein
LSDCIYALATRKDGFRRAVEENEKATRQQGGLFSRENSSNGGKAIRTFWRNLMVGSRGCQGKIKIEISLII